MLKHSRFWIVLFLTPTVLLFLFLYAYPMLTILGTSFTDWRLASEVSFVGFSQYRKMLDHSAFLSSLTNTVVWLLLHWVFYVGIALAVALSSAKKGLVSSFVRVVYLIPNMIPLAALAFIFYLLFSPSIGLINEIIGAFVPGDFLHNWYQHPTTAFLTVTLSSLLFGGILTLLIAAEISSISPEVFESARMDGAGNVQTAFYVTIPLLRNIIGVCLILTTVHVLKMFELVFLTTNGGPGNLTMNLPVMIYRTAMFNNNFGYSNAIAVVTILVGVASMLTISQIFRTGKAN